MSENQPPTAPDPADRPDDMAAPADETNLATTEAAPAAPGAAAPAAPKN
jgi:hypothetical protein